MAQMQRVKVLRAFRHRGSTYAAPSVLDIERPIAVELRTANKVEFVSPETKLVHETKLPDPNKVLADRRAARAAAMEATNKASEASAKAAVAGGK